MQGEAPQFSHVSLDHIVQMLHTLHVKIHNNKV